MTKFSIVIPAYNAEKFIERCVASVISQSFKDWEIILIENGSTDDTPKICKNLSIDPNISFFHSEKGVSVARNLGIEKAKGEYLLFLDADDVLPSNTLEKYNFILKSNKPAMIIGKYLKKNKVYSEKVETIKGLLINDYLDDCLYNPTKMCNVAGVLFNTLVLKKNKIFFDVSLTHAEDSVFFVEALKKSREIILIDSPVYKYIYSSNSTVRKRDNRDNNVEQKYIKSIKRLYQDLKDSNVENSKYVFSLNQLLIVLVHNTLVGKSVKEQYKRYGRVVALPEFRLAIKNANVNKCSLAKKIVFKSIKNKNFVLTWLMVKIRQLQNKFRENR